jgi:hypothetical protein
MPHSGFLGGRLIRLAPAFVAAFGYVFPRSYDVTSGYGFLGTDYFTWMLAHNETYWRYDQDPNDHRMDLPADGSNDAAIERVVMAGGSSLYDTAAWSVALAAAARNEHFSAEEKADFGRALNAYGHFLLSGSYPGGLAGYRATGGKGGPPWRYGDSGQDPGQGGEPRAAYAWSYSPPSWRNPDPHWDPQAEPGARMDWPVWEGGTGEEAWGAFIGPLQTAFCQNGGRPGWAAATAPADGPSLVENACRALAAVALMQGAAGGVYRNARPPNAPESPKWTAISLENNWSLYAGLGFLETALLDLQASLPDYGSRLPFDLDASLASLRKIRLAQRGFFLNGGLVWHARGEPFGEPAAVDHGFFLQGAAGR